MNFYCNLKIQLQMVKPLNTIKSTPQYETAVRLNPVIHLQRRCDSMAGGRGERQQHSAH